MTMKVKCYDPISGHHSVHLSGGAKVRVKIVDVAARFDETHKQMSHVNRALANLVWLAEHGHQYRERNK
jgi:hypothetical protein